MNCILSFIVCLDLGKFFKVVSNSPPEAEVFVLTGEERFEVVEDFSNVEINERYVTQSPLFVSDKIFEVVDFGSELFQDFSFSLLVIRIKAKSNNGSIDFPQNSSDSINLTFILSILPKKISLS